MENSEAKARAKRYTAEEFKAEFKIGDSIYVGTYDGKGTTERGVITAFGEKTFLYRAEHPNKYSYRHENPGHMERMIGWVRA